MKKIFGLVLLSAMLSTTSYGQLADGHDKFLGNVYSASQIQDFATYWNQVTPENAGKWGSVEAVRDSMNWDVLDAAYAFAKEHGFVFRYHVLVWGNQQPAWIEDLPVDEQRAEIEEWFDAIAERYPDVDYLEVVNEPLHDPPNQPGQGGGNYIEALGGDGETGWDWIVTAFRMARERFPNAQLLINDYSIVNNDEDTQRYLSIINLLQAEDLIDGIGVQCHAFSLTGDEAQIQRNLDALATAGLPIQVTELDIDGPTDEKQREDYQRIFPTLWEHDAIIGITLWGWRPGQWRTFQGANLVTQDDTPKPAFEWLQEYLGE